MDALKIFFICGAPKSGTTSLYEYLYSHPDICMSRPKETGYFFENYEQDLAGFWENHFDHCREATVLGEASAGNMLHEEVAPRLARHFEDAKLIFLLRDPVERLYSHYRFAINVGYLPPTTEFSQIIRDEENEWRQTMVELGMYHKHLVRYANHFSRDQMLVLLFKNYTSETGEIVRQCFEFIGVDPDVEVETEQIHNETANLKHPGLYQAIYQLWKPLKNRLPERGLNALFGIRSAVRGLFFQSGSQEKPQLCSEDRAYLSSLYTEPNARLQEWLQSDLSHWTGMGKQDSMQENGILNTD